MLILEFEDDCLKLHEFRAEFFLHKQTFISSPCMQYRVVELKGQIGS
jgi:hypothetical protein